MNRLTNEQRVRILSCLVEGCSVRATCRMVGAAKGTVLSFLADMGAVCQDLHDQTVRGLRTVRMQADEAWTFVHSKARNTKPHKRAAYGHGDAWTWSIIDADSKLIIAWRVGERSAELARAVMLDAADRIASEKVQVTTDGLNLYRSAVDRAFGDGADFAQLDKLFSSSGASPDTRYSPAVCIGCVKRVMRGSPRDGDISTSYAERQNLTIRMHNRRYTRLTNAFSKTRENLRHSMAIHFVYYNFIRIHQTLRVTPAMQAGVTNRLWELSDLADLLEAKERTIIGTEANKRGPYHPRKPAV